MLIFFVNVIFKIKRYIEIKKSTVNCHKFYNVFKWVYLSGVPPAFRKKTTLSQKYNKLSIWTAYLHNYRYQKLINISLFVL